MIAHWLKGRVCVVDASTVYLVNEIRSSALEKLEALGQTPEQAAKILDTPVRDSVWRSTFLAAIGNSVVQTDAALSEVVTTADLATVKETQQQLNQSLQTLRGTVAESALRSELRECMESLEREHARCMAIVAKDWRERDHAAFSAGIWKRLMATPTGQRAIEIRETL